MARPINADPDATRRRLLNAAIKLFAHRGFDGATTRELAGAAKVNVGTLSYYFGGKEGLYDATVDEVYRRLSERAQEAIAGAPPSSIAELVAGVYRAGRAERDGVRLLLRQIVDHGRLTARTESKHFLPGLEAMSTLAEMRIGCSKADARAGAVALGYAVSRFVIQDDASLKSAFGAATVEEAHERVIATLATTANALFGLGVPARSAAKRRPARHDSR